MSFVAAIFADPEKSNLTKQFIDEIISKCEGYQGYEILEEGLAAKIYSSAELQLRRPDFDIITYPRDRKFSILVSDMESTIIANEFLDEIGDYLGIKEQIEKITARAMNGELDFEQSLAERINLVKGLKREEAERLLKDRLIYNPGAKTLVARLKTKAAKSILVSGGFTLFTSKVAEELGFDEHYANQLIFENEALAGVKKPILGKNAKLEIMQAKCAENNVKLTAAVALGDGANDLPMLRAAGLGIAYYAKPNVKKEIRNQLNNADLSALSYLF